ncbi:hypothetical protein FQA39_LY16792 [Lamprigera yunnana]|nr:hypothetical protein FQA39_LY16792 [Lamprigera yunnana]
MYVNFVIPQSKNELLSDNDEQYYVRNVVSVKELHSKIREAKQCFRDEGSEFILDNFDTYYSILHHSDALSIDVVIQGFEDLQKATEGLNNNINFLLEDKDGLTPEFNLKYVTVIKMLIYVYTNIVVLIEQKIESRRSQTLTKAKQRKKNNDDIYGDYDKKFVLVTLNNIMQLEINTFWDPPVVEDMFINLIAEVCYRFLENPLTKSDKELCTELFNTLGTLIKGYNHGVTFVVRIVQLIKIHEHLNHCVPSGVQLLVKNYNCKGLVRDFVQEITEWQTDEKFQDLQGGRNCSAVLLQMANVMPELMIPEVMYLDRYLSHDSYTLRNSVLHVITEVVLQVLTKDDLSEEERESRDDFLAILKEHIQDTAALVRAKVFQHWARLQQENAIPLKMQSDILEHCIIHLRDKAANVRKAAANCVTVFLSHNIYGSKLQLELMEAQLIAKSEELNKLRARLEDSHINKLKELREQFQLKEQDLRDAICKELEAGYAMPEETAVGIHLPEIIRIYMDENKFKEIFKMCCNKDTSPEWEKLKDGLSLEEQTNFFLSLIYTIFTDITSYNSITKSTTVATELDLDQLVALENGVEYLTNTVEFLKLIDSAILPMSDLLESTSIGDMQEAVDFFIAAYKFNINNALFGILEMLKIMQRNEQERRDLIISAFKTIYLTTDSTTMKEHTTQIVTSLINLLKTVPYKNHHDLQLIISEWVSKSILDNSIVDMLWQYFTKKVEVSDEDSRAALALLMMATMGRRTIGSKNIKLVATMTFGQRGEDDILLLKIGCDFLEKAACEKQDISDINPPFKIKATDSMWKDLINIIIKHFTSQSCYYNDMINSAVNCIYGLCSKPEKICEQILDAVVNMLSTQTSNTMESYVVMQLVHLLGKVALQQLNFLDETVYKELKRRNYIREERKCSSKNRNKKVSQVQNASAAKRVHSINQSNLVEDSITSVGDESTLEGAQADDTDAEFILNVLENNTVSELSGLGQLAYILVTICENCDIYDDVHVQGNTVIALLRFMLVSSKMCKKYIQLVFTILEKTTYPEVKINILIHCSDLLERFPNIIEPWTARIYQRLLDSCFDVRKSTFYVLANLILRDMIRVQGHISEMARCIVDEHQELRAMSKNFFTQLSHKANNLYNVLPDIFSHLSDCPLLGEENLKLIMKFLFGLIDKNKQMENLVERFCSKFRLTEDAYKCRNIAYCLSLIQMSEKGLQNLIDSFACYRNTLQFDEVYALFQQIVTTSSKSAKNEIKTLGAELGEKVNSVFESNEDGTAPSVGTPVATQSRTVFKKPKVRPPPKKVRKKKQSNDSDDSDGDEKENTFVRPVRQVRRTPRRVNSASHNDDSD